MDIVYFISTLMAAWIAFNLYYPIYKSELGTIPSFLAGWIIGEAIPHIIIAQAIATTLFAMIGAIDGFWGNLGILITIVSWVAMVCHYATSFRAKEVVEEALTTALGKDYQKKIAPELQSQTNKTVDVEKIIKPWLIDRNDVERIKNILYDNQDGLNLKLDIYRHRSEPKDLPVLFQIHGGGWTYRMGSKNEQSRPLMNHMAANGWICVSVDYRLSPKATFPEHIIDCKKAFSWVKDNIGHYGGNPDFIVVTGGSAGGHLSSLFALSANDPKFQPGFEDVDTTVRGCIPYYGIYDLTDTHNLHANPGLYKLASKTVLKKSKTTHPDDFMAASPLHRIHKNAPPFFIIHGNSDTLTSQNEAIKFAEDLREISKNPVAFADIPGAQHAFDIFPSIRSEYCKLGVERFANALYSKYLTNQQEVKDTISSLSKKESV